MELFIYAVVGIVGSFPLFWFAYRMVRHSNQSLAHSRKLTHRELKVKTLEAYLAPILIGGLIWPITYFFVIPIALTVYAVVKAFNWAIDCLEGEKNKEEK